MRLKLYLCFLWVCLHFLEFLGLGFFGGFFVCVSSPKLVSLFPPETILRLVKLRVKDFVFS